MEGFLGQVYTNIVNYKVNKCCFVAPLRQGVLILGYFNIIFSIILILGAASNTFAPMFKQVQRAVFEDASNITGVLNPTIELGFNVILLCGMHRDDIKLLQVYTYYGLAAIAKTIIEYSMVIIGISAVYTIVIFISILYQAYTIFLVRSAIVEIRLQEHKHENGYLRTTDNRPSPNGTFTENNEQDSPQSNIVELPPKKDELPRKKADTQVDIVESPKNDVKVETVNEKKPEVKFEKVSKGAIARLSEKYKITSGTKDKNNKKADESKVGTAATGEVNQDASTTSTTRIDNTNAKNGSIARLSEKYQITSGTKDKNDNKAIESKVANTASNEVRNDITNTSKPSNIVTEASKSVILAKVSNDKKQISNLHITEASKPVSQSVGTNEAIAGTSKNLQVETKTSDATKDTTNVKDKVNVESEKAPVPKKRGLFRRNKTDKK